MLVDHSAVAGDLILQTWKSRTQRRMAHKYNRRNFKAIRRVAAEFACSRYFDGEENKRCIRKLESVGIFPS